MPTAIALLRGINVGGKNILPMATLRDLCESCGLRDARTYIQSGNVVFRADKKQLARAADSLADSIHKKLKFRPPVIIRSTADVAAALETNPFASLPNLNKRRCLIMFLESEPSAAAAKAIKALKSPPDEVRLIGREAYLHLPNGIADATLPLAQVEKLLAVASTSRNLNTTEKLLAMAAQLESA